MIQQITTWKAEQKYKKITNAIIFSGNSRWSKSITTWMIYQWNHKR